MNYFCRLSKYVLQFLYTFICHFKSWQACVWLSAPTSIYWINSFRRLRDWNDRKQILILFSKITREVAWSRYWWCYLVLSELIFFSLFLYNEGCFESQVFLLFLSLLLFFSSKSVLFLLKQQRNTTKYTNKTDKIKYADESAVRCWHLAWLLIYFPSLLYKSLPPAGASAQWFQHTEPSVKLPICKILFLAFTKNITTSQALILCNS